MKNILKILVGAILTAGISCMSYLGLYELTLRLKEVNLHPYIFVILEMGLIFIMPVFIVIVSVLAFWINKKQKYLSSCHCLSMLLMVDFLFVIMGYFGAGSYCRKLGFEEGLAFVLELLISLAVAGVWALILMGLLIYEHKKNK